MTFQAKPTTKLSKLMKAYCERQVVDYASVVFSYDGQRIREDQTPGEVRSVTESTSNTSVECSQPGSCWRPLLTLLLFCSWIWKTTISLTFSSTRLALACSISDLRSVCGWNLTVSPRLTGWRVNIKTHLELLGCTREPQNNGACELYKISRLIRSSWGMIRSCKLIGLRVLYVSSYSLGVAASVCAVVETAL